MSNYLKTFHLIIDYFFITDTKHKYNMGERTDKIDIKLYVPHKQFNSK